jgi:hypothetical protein
MVSFFFSDFGIGTVVYPLGEDEAGKGEGPQQLSHCDSIAHLPARLGRIQGIEKIRPVELLIFRTGQAVTLTVSASSLKLSQENGSQTADFAVLLESASIRDWQSVF